MTKSEESLFHFLTQIEWPAKALKVHHRSTSLNIWTWNLRQGTGLLTFTAVEYCSAYFWHSSILLCFISISDTSIYKHTQVRRKRTRNPMLSNNLRSQTLRNIYITSDYSSLPHCTFFLNCSLYLFIYLFIWLHHMACGILVSQPGIEPVPSAVKAPSPNHWIAREFPLPHCT